MAHHHRTKLVLAALNMAIGQRRPKGFVHHSDKRAQYTSLALGKRVWLRQFATCWYVW